jgi:hypothetical protein
MSIRKEREQLAAIRLLARIFRLRVRGANWDVISWVTGVSPTACRLLYEQTRLLMVAIRDSRLVDP